jgi:hypothetical protein
MHWSTIRPALIDLFSRLALPYGADAPDGWGAAWEGRQDNPGFTPPAVRFDLSLNITNVSSDGHDGTRYEYDEDDDALYETQFGMRRFTLQVQAFVHEHTDDLTELEILERIRTRIRKPSSLAALKAVNVGLIDVLAAVPIRIVSNKRTISAGNMDVFFAAAVNDADPIPVGWFERVVITSELKGSGGTLLGSPPNVTDLVVPPADEDP